MDGCFVIEREAAPVSERPTSPHRKGSGVEGAVAAVAPMRLARRVVDKDRESVLDEFEDLIVAIARKRDRAAFRALFDHFAPRLKTFFMRGGLDPAAAEEIVQETMVKVWRKADQFDPAKAKASTWIFSIGRNLRVDFLRKEKRPQPDFNDPMFVPDPEPDGFEVLSVAQEADLVREAFDALPPDQKAVMTLAFYEEKPHSEIASELGLPLGTVKSRIRLAFQRIRSGLGESV
ncbi:sigma-70 family RNA polymerase sigma factor [Pacificispira spongiicola]|nr:sigma-70 family RNA polymerase sigma factor [Pacificispira spongiicola]